jgi:hypothetical protein
MTTFSLEPAFDNHQLAELRSHLGSDYERLLPRLEYAVRRYSSVPAPGERHRERAHRHVAAAERLARARDRLLNRLERTKCLIDEARNDYLIPLDRYGMNLPDGFDRLGLYELMGLTPTLRSADQTRAAVQALREDAELWLHNARRLARKPRGRKRGDPRKRVGLCAFTGLALSEVGIGVSTVPTDTWGQVYTIVCEAAKVRLSPAHDVGRDLRAGLDFLKRGNQINETRVLPARSRAHISRRNTSV